MSIGLETGFTSGALLGTAEGVVGCISLMNVAMDRAKSRSAASPDMASARPMHPGLDGFRPRGLGLCAALGASATGAKATILARLQAPQGVEVTAAPARCLPCGLGLDAVPT